MTPSVEHAFLAERLRTGRLFNAFRFAGVTVFLVFNAGVSLVLVLPGWRINWPIFLTYWTVAAGIWLVGRSSDRIARLAGLAIPLIDMPAVAALQWDAMTTANPDLVYGSSNALLLLLIVGAMATLDGREVVLATGVATVALTVLGLHVGGPMVPVIGFSALTMVFAMIGCRYVIGRIRSLVEETTAEQGRRERLGRYFSPEVATLLAEAGTTAAVGETRQVTVIFSDLRDFTGLTEHRSGPDTIALLNDYHERMVRTVFAFGGTLDKYLGDGMMVYFGAPVAQADHAARAVRCALAMQEELAQWNVERERRGEPVLRMGIGVHTGPVVVGDVGAAVRREYTAIGHAVNVAARLQELTKLRGVPVLVSGEVRRATGSGVVFEAIGDAEVRGHSEPVALFVPIVAR